MADFIVKFDATRISFHVVITLQSNMDSSTEMDRESETAEDIDTSVYNSGIVPDVMSKIRDDCEKLMVHYNESIDGIIWNFLS